MSRDISPWLCAALIALLVFAAGEGATCVTQHTDSGQYSVTSCRIGGDAAKIFEELPDDPGFEAEPPDTITRVRHDVGVLDSASSATNIQKPETLERVQGRVLGGGEGPGKESGKVPQWTAVP